ncbi:MAG: NAD(P)H-hydrate dehydratase [Pseudomonadota bacterium]
MSNYTGSGVQNGPDLWLDQLPKPGRHSHKYDRGHTAVLSGGALSTGAARLAAMAALRVGSGLVTVLTPASAALVNAAHLTAVMLRKADHPQDIAATLNDQRFTAVVAGPGLGVGTRTRDKVQTVLESNCATVLDADALTSFSDDPDTLFAMIAEREACDSESAPATVLTPHGGEFARLFGPVDADKMQITARASERAGAIVVHKGSETVIASCERSGGQRLAVNRHASPWLATAGTGDVLAGTIAGLLAQGMPGFEAACAGVWLHGDAAIRLGPAMTAEDMDHGLQAALAGLHEEKG